MSELPMAPIKRIIEKAGAPRVSEEATVALAKQLEEYGEEIALRANRLSKHAGRKTIKAEDIILAVE